MARIAIAAPVVLEDRLLDELRRHGHGTVARCDSADELASILADCGADIAIVAAGHRYLTGRLLEESDAEGVRVIALVASDAERRHAAALGLHELAEADGPWSQIESLIAGTVAAPPRRTGRGRVIAVWGPAGSPGRTTIAIAVAAELAAAGASVALADVDTHSGSIAPALGLLDEAPGFAAACRLAGANSLSRGELERIGERYLSGHGSFWVLTGIGRPNRWPELSGDRVAATLRECRDWVDYTVVDTGASLENDEEISSDLFAPRRNAATIAALREADDVIAVGSADPVGLSRFLRAHVDLVETVLTDRVTVVMNRVRPGAIGPHPAAQVAQALLRFGGISSPVIVPNDQPALDTALLTGRSLRDVSMRSPARVAIGRFVAARLLPEPAATVPTRRVGPFSRRAGSPRAGRRDRSR
ncbi:MinD-like ATPase involved in chromosome partitioning or flagellar assembly [Marisediminicola sp. UYEF4]|uniref:AAA family ATPase n=1 Tax=Marisediminicola sp. UYEF4 TaxID=1756384 RepID=UPI00339540D2